MFSGIIFCSEVWYHSNQTVRAVSSSSTHWFSLLAYLFYVWVGVRLAAKPAHTGRWEHPAEHLRGKTWGEHTLVLFHRRGKNYNLSFKYHLNQWSLELISVLAKKLSWNVFKSTAIWAASVSQTKQQESSVCPSFLCTLHLFICAIAIICYVQT